MIVISMLFTLLACVLSYFHQCYTYWKNRGVRQLKTNPLYGNFFKVKTLHLSNLLQETYAEFKNQGSFAGTYLFTKPIAVVTDLDFVKTILIKDFNKFVDRSNADLSLELNPLAGHLFNLQGEKWRSLRTKLSPTFASGKIKHMFGTIVEVAKRLEPVIQQDVDSTQDGVSVLELHDLLGRYTVDVIGSCAFGIECNSLKDPQAEFRVVARNLFENPKRNVRWYLFVRYYSNLLVKLRVAFPSSGLGYDEFFMRIVRETLKSREQASTRRNDFMDLLFDLRKTENSAGLSIAEITAQVFVFFAAGFETSSSNMSCALFELAQSQTIQQKLRDEIQRVLQRHGSLTYEAMMEMTYLEQVINETLRKYPAVASLTRTPSKDYKLSTNENNHITIEQGTTVHIPVRAIHYDPEIYPEPHKFCPERFDADACQGRHPQAFLGFGDGPRNCIGMRFGRMQVKIGLITLLNLFRFTPAPGEPTELKMKDQSMILVPTGVRLCVERLQSSSRDNCK